jgi:hypothetical protein
LAKLVQLEARPEPETDAAVGATASPVCPWLDADETDGEDTTPVPPSAHGDDDEDKDGAEPMLKHVWQFHRGRLLPSTPGSPASSWEDTVSLASAASTATTEPLVPPDHTELVCEIFNFTVRPAYPPHGLAVLTREPGAV